MSLQVKSYQPPQFETPISNAYAWIAGLAVDFADGNGKVQVYVHPDSASAAALKPPLDQPVFLLGQVLVPAQGNNPAATFPTLTQLFTSAAQVQAANPTFTPDESLRAAIYAALLTVPAFQGSTQVP